MNSDEFLEYAIARKEADLEKDKKAQKRGDREEDEETPSGGGMGRHMRQMKGYMSDMKGMMGRMEGHMQKMGTHRREKDDTETAVQEATDANSERIQQLEATLAETAAALKELKSDVPEGVVKGVRATESDANVNGNGGSGQPGTIEAKAVKETDHLGGLTDFISGGAK